MKNQPIESTQFISDLFLLGQASGEQPMVVINLGAIIFTVIAIGAMLVLAFLFANPRTRPFAWVLVGGGGIFMLVCAFLWFLMSATPSDGLDPIPPMRAAQTWQASGQGEPEENTSRFGRDARDGHTHKSDTENRPGNETSRPTWLDELPRRDGNVYRETIVSDPYTTVRECNVALDGQLVEAASEYADKLLGPGAGEKAVLDASYIREHLVKEERVETVDTSVGEMKRVHLSLEFDEPVRDEIRARHRQAVLAARLWTSGVVAVSLIGLLAAIFGYLRLK